MAAATAGASTRGDLMGTGNIRSIVTAAETNQLSATSGKVSHVLINAVGTTATLDIYDHASANNNPIFRWVTADGKGCFTVQCPCANGVRVISGGTFGEAVVVWVE